MSIHNETKILKFKHSVFEVLVYLLSLSKLPAECSAFVLYGLVPVRYGLVRQGKFCVCVCDYVYFLL